MRTSPRNRYVWIKEFELDGRVADEIVTSLTPFHREALPLMNLEEIPQWEAYRCRYIEALRGIGLFAEEIVEISLSETMLPVDSIGGTDFLRQQVRLGVAKGIGLGTKRHLCDILRDRYADYIVGSPTLRFEDSGMLDVMLFEDIVGWQMRSLNRRFHGVFQLKMVGSERMPFSLPAVLYYQTALRIIGETKKAAEVARLNEFILAGTPPLGMLDHRTFAILGR